MNCIYYCEVHFDIAKKIEVHFVNKLEQMPCVKILKAVMTLTKSTHANFQKLSDVQYHQNFCCKKFMDALYLSLISQQ